ncbi:MAG: amidohydrolase family protein, partial [Anaerolineae bacterium]
AFERAVASCPDTVFLGHGPGFWAHISNDDLYDKELYPKGPVVPGGDVERMLDTYPNFWCDLSAGSALGALSRDREHGRAFLLHYADRLLFARDCFDGKLAAFLEELALPDNVLQAIYHDNAERLVPLSS